MGKCEDVQVNFDLISYYNVIRLFINVMSRYVVLIRFGFYFVLLL